MGISTDHVKIVLPCSNEGEWLRVTIDSLLEHTSYSSFEIFVLANGDTQTDFSFIERAPYRARVKLKSIAEPLGVGRSINAAVWPGDADHYVFLDAHCLVEQHDWLERVVDALNSYPNASMFQPEVVQFSYPQPIAAGEGVDFEAIRPLFYAYSIRWQWPYESLSHIADVQASYLTEEPYEAMAGGGMAVFVRAETFHKLGQHDAEVEGWYPKTRDYCLRAWLLGYPTMVLPSVRVYHMEKTKSEGFSPVNMVHGILRTAFRYFNPRRRALAETLFRRHGLSAEVDEVIERIHKGSWLKDRAQYLRERVHDDDWLFAKFKVYEEHR